MPSQDQHKTPLSFLCFCFASSSASPSQTAAVFPAPRAITSMESTNHSRGARCVVLSPARERHLISSVNVENASTRHGQRHPTSRGAFRGFVLSANATPFPALARGQFPTLPRPCARVPPRPCVRARRASLACLRRTIQQSNW